MHKTFLLTLFLLISSGRIQAATNTDYDDLVRRARAGDTAPVLAFLSQHERDQSLQQREDHIIIASWAGYDQDVLTAYARYPQSSRLSPAVLASVARAYRNLGRCDEAAALFHKAHLLEPDDPQWVMGEMLALSDAAKGAQAVALGRPWVERLNGRLQADMRTVLAYALLSDGARYEALYEMDRAFAVEFPSTFGGELLERFGQVLTRGELPLGALEVDAGLTTVQRLQKQADEMALRVRLVGVDSRREAERFQSVDELLARYASLMQQCAQTSGAEGIARQMRVDRLGAFEARAMPKMVVSEYDALRVEGEIPPYARIWVARALLRLRQPMRAEAIMASALKDSPDAATWVDGHALRAQALSESHRIDESRRELEAIMPLVGRYRWVLNYPATELSMQWMSLQINHAGLMNEMARNRDAQVRAAELCRYHADSIDPCITLSDIYRVNGWPRRAEQQLKLTESTAPRALLLEQSQGYTALSLREWHQGDLLTDDLTQRFPEDPGVQRLARANQVAHMAELRMFGGPTHSSSVSRVRGSHSLAMESTLYTPRFHDNWRLFAGEAYSSSDFEDENGHGRWQHAGVEYSGRDVLITAGTSYQQFSSQGHEQGYRLSFDYDLNDVWHWGALAARRSTEAPLRARIQGIDANQYQVHGQWTPDDQHTVQLSYTQWRYSDSNRRGQVGLFGTQRLWASTNLRLEGLLGIDAGRSLLSDNLAYYSPKSDVGVLPALRLTHDIYTFYENQWSQSLELGAGRSWQSGESSAPMLLAHYGQRLKMNDVLELGATLGWERQAYDGNREQDLQLSLDLDYRF